MKHGQKLRRTLILLAAFHVVVLFAGFFAPYNSSTQNRDFPFAPPTRLHLVDTQRHFHARPFMYGLKNDSVNSSVYENDPAKVHPLRFFVTGSPYKVAGVFESRTHIFGLEDQAQIFLLGTDAYGRDQLSRFLYGGQISLFAGLLAAALSLLLGVAVGAIAGFYGGWIDEALMRGGELFLALPWLYLLLAVRAALPLRISEWQVFLLLIGVIGLIGWARPARLIRSVVLSAKERSFVLAARGFGASDVYLLRRHVLPQTGGVVLTQMTLLIPQYVLAEVTLTFLGLGVGEPMPSWGSLLSSSQQYYVLSSYWWMGLPALLLVPLFLTFYEAADALQERWKSVPL